MQAAEETPGAPQHRARGRRLRDPRGDRGRRRVRPRRAAQAVRRLQGQLHDQRREERQGAAGEQVGQLESDDGGVI